MINKFNNENLASLRTQIQEALNQVAKANGLRSINLGNISYSGEEFTAKVTAKTNASLEVAKTNLEYFGLPTDLIGKEFTYKKFSYKITDFDSRRRSKYCVQTVRADGVKTRFTLELIKDALNLNK